MLMDYNKLVHVTKLSQGTVLKLFQISEQPHIITPVTLLGQNRPGQHKVQIITLFSESSDGYTCKECMEPSI